MIETCAAMGLGEWEITASVCKHFGSFVSPSLLSMYAYAEPPLPLPWLQRKKGSEIRFSASAHLWPGRPTAYKWRRHPLTLRFEDHVMEQQFRHTSASCERWWGCVQAVSEELSRGFRLCERWNSSSGTRPPASCERVLGCIRAVPVELSGGFRLCEQSFLSSSGVSGTHPGSIDVIRSMRYQSDDTSMYGVKALIRIVVIFWIGFYVVVSAETLINKRTPQQKLVREDCLRFQRAKYA